MCLPTNNPYIIAARLVLIVGYAISRIVIGAIKLNAYCTSEMLAIYLIVSGSLGLLNAILSPLDLKDDDGNYRYLPLHVFCVLIDLAILCWFIAGSCWVFSSSPGTNYEFCDRLLYDFAFSVTIVGYILLALKLVVFVYRMCVPVSCCGSS